MAIASCPLWEMRGPFTIKLPEFMFGLGPFKKAFVCRPYTHSRLDRLSQRSGEVDGKTTVSPKRSPRCRHPFLQDTQTSKWNAKIRCTFCMRTSNFGENKVRVVASEIIQHVGILYVFLLDLFAYQAAQLRLFLVGLKTIHLYIYIENVL